MNSVLDKTIQLVQLFSSAVSSRLKWSPEQIPSALQWCAYFERATKNFRSDSNFTSSLDLRLQELTSDTPSLRNQLNHTTLQQARLLLLGLLLRNPFQSLETHNFAVKEYQRIVISTDSSSARATLSKDLSSDFAALSNVKSNPINNCDIICKQVLANEIAKECLFICSNRPTTGTSNCSQLRTVDFFDVISSECGKSAECLEVILMSLYFYLLPNSKSSTKDENNQSSSIAIQKLVDILFSPSIPKSLLFSSPIAIELCNHLIEFRKSYIFYAFDQFLTAIQPFDSDDNDESNGSESLLFDDSSEIEKAISRIVNVVNMNSSFSAPYLSPLSEAVIIAANQFASANIKHSPKALKIISEMLSRVKLQAKLSASSSFLFQFT